MSRRLKWILCHHEGSTSGLDRVGAIDWALLRRAAVSLHRFSEAVKRGAVVPSDFLKMANVYDENGVNVAQALRELGKIARTEFIFSYATDPSLRERVFRSCQRAEAWNAFQREVVFDNGGRIATNSPRRREEIGLAMLLVLNGIVFHNVWKHGDKLRKTPSATPIVRSHVNLLGRYRITKRRSTSRNGLDSL